MDVVVVLEFSNMNSDFNIAIVNQEFSVDSENEKDFYSTSSDESLIDFDEPDYLVTGSTQKKTVHVRNIYDLYFHLFNLFNIYTPIIFIVEYANRTEKFKSLSTIRENIVKICWPDQFGYTTFYVVEISECFLYNNIE